MLTARVVAVVVLALAACDRTFAVTQPVAFPHKVHIDSGLECTFCHESVETATSAGVPTRDTCLTCHDEPPPAAASESCLACHDVPAPEGSELQKLSAYLARGTPVPWRRIYDLPTHVFFSHRRHVAVARIECAECHGDVPSLVAPASQPLVEHRMDWCLGCHEARGATTDCIHCHR